MFSYLSYILDDTSRVNVIVSASYSIFKFLTRRDCKMIRRIIPRPAAMDWGTFMAAPNFNSSNLNENQNEQNYYGVASYQKTAGNLNYQVVHVWPSKRRAFHAQ